MDRKKLLINCSFVIGVILAVLIFVNVVSDNKKTKADVDGLVLTDKSGKSYIVEHSYGSNYRLSEFDTGIMRKR